MRRSKNQFYLDPLYTRWRSALNRYQYSHAEANLNRDRSTPLMMAREWLPPDTKGFVAFREWVLAQVAKKGIGHLTYRVTRKDESQGFTPENCEVVAVGKGSKPAILHIPTKIPKAAEAELTRLEQLYGLRPVA